MSQEMNITDVTGDDLLVRDSTEDGEKCALVLDDLGGKGIKLDLTCIAKLRAALDQAETAYVNRSSLETFMTTTVEPPAVGPVPYMEIQCPDPGTVRRAAITKFDGDRLATPQDISAAVAWAREQYEQGKRKLLIVHREVPMPSPASRHPDDVALRQGVGLVVAECCYGVAYKLIGYMRDDMEAAFCCAGVPLDVARHVARLVPTWTQEGRVNR